MNHGIILCSECNNIIINDNPIYMAFDSMFCSKNCSIERIKIVKKIDPQFKSPSSWKNLAYLDKNKDNYLDSLNVVIKYPLKKTVSNYSLSEISKGPYPVQEYKKEYRYKSEEKVLKKENQYKSEEKVLKKEKIIPYSLQPYMENYVIDSIYNTSSYCYNLLPYIIKNRSYIKETVYNICGYYS